MIFGASPQIQLCFFRDVVKRGYCATGRWGNLRRTKVLCQRERSSTADGPKYARDISDKRQHFKEKLFPSVVLKSTSVPFSLIFTSSYGIGSNTLYHWIPLHDFRCGAETDELSMVEESALKTIYKIWLDCIRRYGRGHPTVRCGNFLSRIVLGTDRLRSRDSPAVHRPDRVSGVSSRVRKSEKQ